MGAVLTGEENDWDEDAFYETGRVEIQKIINEIDEIAPELPRESALDFGCGLGRLTFSLAKHFNCVTGVDISEKMLEQAKANRNLPSNLSFILNTRSDLRQLENDQFDLSLSLIVLQHIPRKYMEAYLSEFIRITRPGGIIVFQIPHRTAHRFWKDKPLRSDSPSLGTLCYRASARFLRWFPRKLEHAFFTSDLWFRYRYAHFKRSGNPVMEMNSWKRTSLEKFLEKHGASIVRCRRDPEIHAGLESHVYLVQKLERPKQAIS